MRHRAWSSHQEAMHADPTRHDLDTAPFDIIGDVHCPTCGDTFSSLCDRCPDDGTPLVPSRSHSDPLIGTIIDDRYRITRTLAEGAMGVVYEAVQLSIKRPVAIKVVRRELARDPVATHRFLREARLLTRIAHPNIVDVFDYGESNGRLYLVMELLRGNTLDAILAHDGPFTADRTCEIALRLCDALAAAHTHDVVHRDLKPSNIVLLPTLGDWVKVIDFGLAKQLDDESEVTYVGAVIGTPLYMAPEAVRCDAPDPRSDLYALGCIIHELLTGKPPFESDSSAMVLVRQLDDAAPPLPDDVPHELRELVAHLLAKSAEDRPSSALEVRAALLGCLARMVRPPS